MNPMRLAVVGDRWRTVADAWRRPHEQRSLNQRVMVSSLLSTTEFGIEGVTRLVSTVILTRLLSPEDFGAFAVVLFVLYLLVMVTDLGIRSLVLTHDGTVNADFLRSCWTVQLIRGGLLSVAVVGIGLGLVGAQSAGWVAEGSAYADADLPWVICGASAVLLLQSGLSPKMYLYERDMRFVRLSAMRITLTVLGAALTIGLVWWLGSLWALLFGQVAATALQVAASFLLFRGPSMRLRLAPEATRAILERGRWIMGHSGLTAATELADRVMFSLFLGAAEFGQYHIAKQILSLFAGLANSVTGRFGLQYFTQLQATFDPAGVSREYYRYRLAFDAFLAITAGALFALAPLIVGILYDDRYADVAPVLQLLALGLPLIGTGFIRAAFSAQRRFRAMTFLGLIQTGSIWLGLVVALPVLGSPLLALFVVALHRLPELAVLLWKARREGWIRFRHEARVIPLFTLGVGLAWIAETAWVVIGIPLP